MRELIFKNLTTSTSRKRDVSVQEIVERNGLISSTEKRSIYFIRDIHRMKSQSEIADWIEKKRSDSALAKKSFHILREYSDKDKKDKLICKMRGAFYIMSGDAVYNIVFVHEIKIKIRKME